MPEAVKNKRETIESARDLLQRLHDYIETEGFDIWSAYAGGDLNPSSLRKARAGDFSTIHGTVCFIGGARLVAGVRPGWNYTDEGDGPELTLGLELLDEAVEMVAEPDILQKAMQQAPMGEGPGKLAERFGMVLNLDEESDNKEALWLVRAALRRAAEQLGEV